MKHFINFIKGMIIGIANIIPGVSGGTMAVTTGIYEQLISSIGNFFKKFKETFVENMKFLIPIGLGAVIGIVLFSKLLKYLLDNFEMATKFAFMGLIIGSFPLIFKNSVSKGFKKKNLIPFVITFAIGLTLTILQMMGIAGTEVQSFDMNFVTVVLLFVYGAIAASAMVVPGISGSFILLLIGVYKAILSAVSSLNIPVLIPFALGAAVGVIAIAKLIDVLLNKWHGGTYLAIIGFIIGTLPAIFPGFAFNMQGIISIIVFVVGVVLSYLASKLES